MLKLELTNARLHLAGAGLLVIPLFEDRIPLRGTAGWVDWLLCGRLSRALIQGGLKGARSEKVVLMGCAKLKAEMVMAYGLGRAEKILPSDLERMFIELVGITKDMGVGGFSAPVPVEDFQSWEYEELIRAMLKGIFIGYSFLRGNSEEGFTARIIEESVDRLKAMEETARVVAAGCGDKIDWEVTWSGGK